MCDHSIFQSNVQLGLDFLSPESVGDAVRLAEEIRCVPNEHEAKLQVLEVRREELHLSIKFLFCCHLPVPPYFVLLKCLCFKNIFVSMLIYASWAFMQVGKISLYAASSAIKEVQKLVLDPKYANFTLVLAIALVLSLPTSLSLKMENKLFCLTNGSYPG